MGKCPGRLRCPREHVGDAVSEEEGQSRHGLDTGGRTGDRAALRLLWDRQKRQGRAEMSHSDVGWVSMPRG